MSHMYKLLLEPPRTAIDELSMVAHPATARPTISERLVPSSVEYHEVHSEFSPYTTMD